MLGALTGQGEFSGVRVEATSAGQQTSSIGNVSRQAVVYTQQIHNFLQSGIWPDCPYGQDPDDRDLVLLHRATNDNHTYWELDLATQPLLPST